MNTHTANTLPQRNAFGDRLMAELNNLPSSKRLAPAELEVIYSLAYAHVVQNQHAKALPIFALLTQYAPTRRHYLAGLALCLQMVGRYEQAIGIQSMLLVLYPENLEPALHIAESQTAQGDVDAARHSLRQLEQAGVEQPLAAKVNALLERLARQEAAIA